MVDCCWKAKPKQTWQLSETRETSVLVLTSQYVTTGLFLVSLLVQFCTPLQVKFQVFRQLKQGEEKLILKKIFDFLIRMSCRFDQANKKNLSYTL